MCFELTDIDDVIGFCNRGDQMKTVIFEALLTGNGSGSEIHIQPQIRFQRGHTADLIQIFHMFGIIKAAGAFGERDVCHAMLAQKAHYGTDYDRVRCDRKGRTLGKHEIRLDDNFKPGAKILRNLQGIHCPANGRIDPIFTIFRYLIKCLEHTKTSFLFGRLIVILNS